MGVTYEVMWFWSYFYAHSHGGYQGTGFDGFHPWYYGFFGALYIFGLVQLYPLARNFDDMAKM
jgi:hypothetical protein